METISDDFNELLRRREVTIKIGHGKSATPSRVQIKEKIASELKCDPKLTFVVNINTPTGRNESIVEAHVYESQKYADLLVPNHIKARGEPKKAEKEEPKPKEKPKESKSPKPK